MSNGTKWITPGQGATLAELFAALPPTGSRESFNADCEKHLFALKHEYGIEAKTNVALTRKPLTAKDFTRIREASVGMSHRLSDAEAIMDKNGTPHLLNVTMEQNKPCGCKIIGNGTLPHPLGIQFCEKHEALSELAEMLKRLTEKAGYINRQQHAGQVVIREDWSELYQLEHHARAILAKCEK